MTAGEESCGCRNGETQCECVEKKDFVEKKLQPVKAPRIYRDRRVVKGEVVTIIDVDFSSSGIDLAESWSRAVIRGDIHEVMLWNSLEAGDEDAAAVAFFEVTQGGNIVNGDEVRVDGELIGSLAGFDYNHMPNHMNIVVETKTLEIPLKLGSIIEFLPNPILYSLDQADCC